MASELSHLALEPLHSTEASDSEVINVTESGARLSVTVCTELARLWSLKQQIPTLTSINAWAALWNADGRKVHAWFVRKKCVANRAGTFVEGDYELTLTAPPPPIIPKKRDRKRKVKGHVSVKRELLSPSPLTSALVLDPPPPPTIALTKNIGKSKEKIRKKKTSISVKRELLSPAPRTSKKPRMTTEQLAAELDEAALASTTIPISKSTPITSSPIPGKKTETPPSEPCAYMRSSRCLAPKPSETTQAPSPTIAPDAQPDAPRLSFPVYTELQRIWSLKQQIPTKTSIDSWSTLWNADALRVNAWFARRRLVAKRAGTFVEGTYEMALDSPPPPPPPPSVISANAEKEQGKKRKRDDGASVKREFSSPSPSLSKKPRTSTEQVPDDDETGIPGSEDTLVPSSSPAPEEEHEVTPFEPFAYTRSSRRLRALSPIKILAPKELRYSTSVSAPGSPSPSPSPSRSPTPDFQYPVLSFDDDLILDFDPHTSKTDDINMNNLDATDHEESEPLICGISSGFTCTLCLPAESDMDATLRPAPTLINIPLTYFLRNASPLSLRSSTETYLAVLEAQHAHWESKFSPSVADAVLVGLSRPKEQVVFMLRSG